MARCALIDAFQSEALQGLGSLQVKRGHIVIEETAVIGSGGFGVVLRGTLLGRSSPVAIKRLRSYESNDVRVACRLVREMRIWSRLHHPGVLPLLGFYLSTDMSEALIICPFEPQGNILEYLQRVRPDVHSRLGLALDTLAGLSYLHGLVPPVVHGDIKALNVLVNSENRALLCDFGLAIAADEVPEGLITSQSLKGSWRWCSPELLMSEIPRTQASDIWAWACLLVEILKETLPYAHIKQSAAVIHAIGQGQLPAPESHLREPSDIISLVNKCWQINPALRASAEVYSKDLSRIKGGIHINRQLTGIDTQVLEKEDRIARSATTNLATAGPLLLNLSRQALRRDRTVKSSALQTMNLTTSVQAPSHILPVSRRENVVNTPQPRPRSTSPKTTRYTAKANATSRPSSPHGARKTGDWLDLEPKDSPFLVGPPTTWQPCFDGSLRFPALEEKLGGDAGPPSTPIIRQRRGTVAHTRPKIVLPRRPMTAPEPRARRLPGVLSVVPELLDRSWSGWLTRKLVRFLYSVPNYE
ncbi:hypothetical protein FRB93_006281 [Tulasnella sp. JGI-2019a]|nr:hypothetical protein FRB93_006281 [Tulasnella sp. JGI-2019a]